MVNLTIAVDSLGSCTFIMKIIKSQMCITGAMLIINLASSDASFSERGLKKMRTRVE